MKKFPLLCQGKLLSLCIPRAGGDVGLTSPLLFASQQFIKLRGVGIASPGVLC